jgi:schlafen family protein
MCESWDYEEKSAFAGEDNDFLDIIKTVIAFANGEGGVLILKGVTCKLAQLDSARLDDRVNKWVAPRIRNITSFEKELGCIVIEVPPSEDAPHVMAHSASYKLAGNKQKPAFHSGQVYVRHSSKTEPATADDIRAMIQKASAKTLSALGDAITRASINVAEGGLPILEPGTVLEITTKDVNNSHPYTAVTLGKKIEKGHMWVSAATRKLGLRDNQRYSLGVLGTNDRVALWKYSEEALWALTEILTKDPDFNPYR